MQLGQRFMVFAGLKELDPVIELLFGDGAVDTLFEPKDMADAGPFAEVPTSSVKCSLPRGATSCYWSMQVGDARGNA